jgi:hypothetical protein
LQEHASNSGDLAAFGDTWLNTVRVACYAAIAIAGTMAAVEMAVQSFQNPRLCLRRGLLSTTHPANPVTAPYRSGSKVR